MDLLNENKKFEEAKSSNEIRVRINAPREKVFEYTLEPKNTPEWVEDAVEMQTSTEQIGIGTIYSNEYIGREVTDYEKNVFLELADMDGNYSCSYSFRKIDEENTELIFFESSNDGLELEFPIEKRFFEKLKEILEE